MQTCTRALQQTLHITLVTSTLRKIYLFFSHEQCFYFFQWGTTLERILDATFFFWKYSCRVVIKSPGPGIFPGYYESGPRLLLLENRRKIEPNKIPSCLISPPTCCVYPATWNLSDNPAAVYSNYWFIHMYSHVYKYLEGSLFNNKFLILVGHTCIIMWCNLCC